MKKIGVLPSSISFALSNPLNDELKQLYLLYDNLTFGENVDYIGMLSNHLMHLGSKSQQLIKQRIKDYVYLIERNILIDVPLDRSKIVYTGEQNNMNEEIQEFAGFRNDISSTLGLFLEDHESRLKSSFINQQYTDVRAFPIASLKSFMNYNDKLVTNTTDVLSIVCLQFPTITNAITWDQILEFKNDPDSYLKYLRLVNWATHISKSAFSVAEIKDYIEYVTLEYTEALRLHKLKYEISKFQTFFNFVAEIIENLLKLKLTDLIKMPIEIKKQKIEMLQEEKQLPGNEIAYFIKAQIELGK